jgi:plastocyanin
MPALPFLLFPLTLTSALLPIGMAMGAARDSIPPVPIPRQGQVGRIVGTVEISSALTARRPRFRVYSDAGPGAVPPARPAGDIAGEMRNVIVYLESGNAPGLDSISRAAVLGDRASAVMAQANERFDPHVLPVMRGARVEFPNRDNIYHNVFSLSSARTFDLGRYPNGSSKSVTFGKTGIVQVFCHIHSDMSAVIVVLANPFFAAPDSTGRYAIENVPPGEYTIVGWHERTRPALQKIRVVAGQTTSVGFSLPLAAHVP